MSSRRSLCVLATALSLMFAAGCGAAPQEATEGDDALVGGTKARQGEFAATLVYKLPDGGTCTGTRVGPRHMLTAAHCVTDPSGLVSYNLLRPAKLEISNFPERRSDDTSLWHTGAIDAVYVTADWASNCSLPGARCQLAIDETFLPPGDIAVVTFLADLPAQWPSAQVATTPVAVGEELTTVGYGCEFGTSTPWSPLVKKKFGKFRVLSAAEVNRPFSSVSAQNLGAFEGTFFVGPGTNYDGQSSATGVSLCPGDSGGPVFRDDGRTVVGINANYTFADDQGYSWTNVFTRTSDATVGGTPVLDFLRGLLPASSFR